MTERTLIIAEAGVNHNGSLELALQLVDVAAQAGADAVKFQTFKADLLATAQAAKAEYQVTNTQEAGSQRDMLRRLELSEQDHHHLLQRCRDRGIRFMSTAFDAASLDMLAGMDMPMIKIPSGDITFAPMLIRAARLGKPMLVSTGMSTLADVEQALAVIAFALTQSGEPRGRHDFEAAYASASGRQALQQTVRLLHCVTQYPAPASSINLRAMDTLRSAFGLPVGYSDHTEGIDVALAAVARGACVIEKHFTLDRKLPGPDHAASLEPSELARMVQAIRVVEDALGSSIKGPSSAEAKNKPIARRSVVAARAIAAGEVLQAHMLACKRPAMGVSPLDFWGLLGRTAHRAYAADEAIDA